MTRTEDAAEGTPARSGVVELDEVGMSYGRGGKAHMALQVTSLTLRAGSFTSLVGPSGCGKSTLLNILAGFITPTTGRAYLDGREITAPSPERGVVFQSYALFPWFTARGNVEFALKRHRLSQRRRRETALSYLAAVGLAAGAERYPAELSGGMQQRVALARTLASEPALLLMDEPFGALDATTRRTMQSLLLQIWELKRTTVLFVTHDVDEALFLSDTVHVMSDSGRITETVDVGSPRPRDINVLTPEQIRHREHVLSLVHRTADSRH